MNFALSVIIPIERSTFVPCLEKFWKQHHTTWREAKRQKLVELRELTVSRIVLLPPGVARRLAGFAEESGPAGMDQA